MNHSQLIRDIKLDRALGTDNLIDRKFQDIWDDLSILNCDVYNTYGQEFIYYNSNKEWIFYQDLKSNRFLCNNERYWLVFESLNVGNYQEIQSFTKYMVEEALKKEAAATIAPLYFFSTKVEEALKKEVATPHQQASYSPYKVEEALKKEIATPEHQYSTGIDSVEDALKKEVATPNTGVISQWLVENSLKDAVPHRKNTYKAPWRQHNITICMLEESLKKETKIKTKI